MMREREAHLVAMRERSGRKREIGSLAPPSPQDGLAGFAVTSGWPCWLRRRLKNSSDLDTEQSQSQMLIRMDGCFCRWEGCVLEYGKGQMYGEAKASGKIANVRDVLTKLYEHYVYVHSPNVEVESLSEKSTTTMDVDVSETNPYALIDS
uniref:Uncharacterized protein n=1 Tax=Fagus sylvatica TaxID=28930 RepID=A0A2N9FLA6_FAGSY